MMSRLSLTEMDSFRIFLYTLIFLLSVLGNLLIIVVLLLNKRMRTVTNSFLMSLAVSDLMMAIFCMPFTLIPNILEDFIFGGAMCKAVSYFMGKDEFCLRDETLHEWSSEVSQIAPKGRVITEGLTRINKTVLCSMACKTLLTVLLLQPHFDCQKVAVVVKCLGVRSWFPVRPETRSTAKRTRSERWGRAAQPSCRVRYEAPSVRAGLLDLFFNYWALSCGKVEE